MAKPSRRRRLGASRVEAFVDHAALLDLWSDIVRTPPWPRPPVWVHGDLHPGNILVRAGRLSAVIDFGDLCAGDPATDLSVAWMLLPASARPRFRAAAGQGAGGIDDDTWRRARGWALALGLAMLAHSRDNDVMGSIARTTLAAVLQDPSNGPRGSL